MVNESFAVSHCVMLSLVVALLTNMGVNRNAKIWLRIAVVAASSPCRRSFADHLRCIQSFWSYSAVRVLSLSNMREVELSQREEADLAVYRH